MKRIDIAKVLEDKNPKLARRLPRFVIRMFERLVRAKKINHILDNYSHLNPVEFIGASLDYIGVDYELHGLENIPKDRRVIFASNHPFGGLDGIILAHGLSKALPETEIKLIVNDVLMNLEPLRPFFVPVNKYGAQGAKYAIAQRQMYESQAAIVTFPAGLCSRLIKGKISDPEWKKNFVVKAREYDRVVIPTFVAGRNTMLFYRVALWRKRLGIKVNIEQILLPREVFAQKNKHVQIYFGKPYITTDTKISVTQMTSQIREAAYGLSVEKLN